MSLHDADSAECTVPALGIVATTGEYVRRNRCHFICVACGGYCSVDVDVRRH